MFCLICKDTDIALQGVGRLLTGRHTMDVTLHTARGPLGQLQAVYLLKPSNILKISPKQATPTHTAASARVHRVHRCCARSVCLCIATTYQSTANRICVSVSNMAAAPQLSGGMLPRALVEDSFSAAPLIVQVLGKSKKL